MRSFVLGCALLTVYGGVTRLAAQEPWPAPVLQPLPAQEMWIGLEHISIVPDSGPSETRVGLMLMSRGSLLFRRAVGDFDTRTMVTDYLEIGAGLDGGSFDLESVRLPIYYGLQVGTLTGSDLQLILRAGVTGNIGYETTGVPFVGGRVRGGRLAFETLYANARDSWLASGVLRWYPVRRRPGVNVALRFEYEESATMGILVPRPGGSDRSLQLAFSLER
jgi:hypothetical protein